MARTKENPTPYFPNVAQCASIGREKHTVVADMDGTLLRGGSSFPYFALVAYEVGGILRLMLLLLASPIAGLLYYFISESAGIRVIIFTSLVGMRVSDIEWVARAVLPKFYSSDLHPETWRVFSSCGRRCVLTANPRVMVEPFLKEYLGADLVMGTEIHVFGGRATGLVKGPGILVGVNKADALNKAFRDEPTLPDIGLGDRNTDFPFIKLCKEGYVVPKIPEVEAVSHDILPKPLVFHDGRLVQKPTPFMALLTILWTPVGFLLACLRVAAAALLPMQLAYYALWALGVRVYIKGSTPPPPAKKSKGILFVCSHRTLLDPVFLSLALGRPVPVVTYSLSRLSELISPIKTVRLSRDRATDASMMKKLLEDGDLVICPEGTTCREPFLLRFSALFAELTDEIVPVAMANQMCMFHGTTARGWKGMDFFYFFMNPSPAYEVTFLNKLPYELSCSGGKSSHEVANYIQRMIAASLSYECTSFTRKDKYRALAGNDGAVVETPPNRVIMGC